MAERLTLAFTGQACMDCVAFLANGGVPEDRPNLIAEIAVQWSIAHIHMATGEIDPDTGDSVDTWFSWSNCDCCGSRLGGNRERFQVFTWQATESEA